MPRFPKNEDAIYELAGKVCRGLGRLDIFPRPPVKAFLLNVKMSMFKSRNISASQYQANYEASMSNYIIAVDALEAAMKKIIRYAENTVDFDDDKLKLIGWGARKEKTITPPPGQVYELAGARQGQGWVELSWKSPADGGKVSAYKVQRSQMPGGPWIDVATSLQKTCRITNQPRLKQLQWRVIAVNKSGEGMPSNIVMTVL